MLTQGDDGEVGGGGEAIDESMEVQIDLLCGDCIIVNFYINAQYYITTYIVYHFV